MADESVVLDVLIELKQEGLEVARMVASQLSDLNDEVKDVNRQLERMSDLAHRDALAMLELAGATNVATAATGAAGGAGFLAGLAQLMPGGTVMGYAILGVIGLALALAPLTVGMVAVAANILAWATLSAVAIPALGALAGAIFMLGAANAGGLNPALEMIKTQKALETAVKEHAAAVKELQQVQGGGGAAIYGPGLSQAQMLNIAKTYVGVTAGNVSDAQRNLAEPMSGLGGPIANLGTAVDDMHDHFEKASRAMADHIALWVTGFLPAIQKAGDAILQWFSARLPAILTFFDGMARTMAPFFASVFGTIGRVIDFVLAHQSEFEGFFSGVLGVASNVFKVLMEIMMNVVTWFDKNWPSIAKTAGLVADQFKKAWNDPAVQEGIKEIKGLLKDVIDHLGDLKTLIPIFGQAVLAMALVIEGGIGGLLALALVLERIVAAAKWMQEHGGKTLSGPGGGITDPNAIFPQPDPNALQPSTPPGRPGENARTVSLLQSIDNHLAVIRRGGLVVV